MFQLILIVALSEKFCHHDHFIDEEPLGIREVKQLAQSHTARFQTPFVCLQSQVLGIYDTSGSIWSSQEPYGVVKKLAHGGISGNQV